MRAGCSMPPPNGRGPLGQGADPRKAGGAGIQARDMEGAIRDFERGPALPGKVSCPRRKWLLVLLLLWETLVQAAHTWFQSLPPPVQTPSDRARTARPELLSNLCHGCWYGRSCDGLWAQKKKPPRVELRRAVPARRELALAYSEHAPAMTLCRTCAGRPLCREVAPVAQVARRSVGPRAKRWCSTAYRSTRHRDSASASRSAARPCVCWSGWATTGSAHRPLPNRRLALPPRQAPRSRQGGRLNHSSGLEWGTSRRRGSSWILGAGIRRSLPRRTS